MNIHLNSIPHISSYSPKHPANGKQTLGHLSLDPYTQRMPPLINSVSAPLEEGSHSYSLHLPPVLVVLLFVSLLYFLLVLTRGLLNIRRTPFPAGTKSNISEFITLCKATIKSFSTIIYASPQALITKAGPSSFLKFLLDHKHVLRMVVIDEIH